MVKEDSLTMYPIMLVVTVMVYGVPGYILCQGGTQAPTTTTTQAKVVPCSIRETFNPTYQGGFWMSAKYQPATQDTQEKSEDKNVMNLIIKVLYQQ